MARPLRVEYAGAWYHLMHRGFGRRKIFLADADRQRFFDLLRDVSVMWGVEVHAYSLMDNHYHLLIHTPSGNLARAMRLSWLENVRDWCISRQIWWGHRIPAWYCQDCGAITVSNNVPKKCSKCSSTTLKQDEDVLDTWFSSALWPFSTLGWPKETSELKHYYPTAKDDVPDKVHASGSGAPLIYSFCDDLIGISWHCKSPHMFAQRKAKHTRRCFPRLIAI